MTSATPRANGWLRAPQATGASDHACWSYSSEVERAKAATRWLRTGLRHGQQALYVADAPVDALIAELAELPDPQSAIDAGALLVFSTADLYDVSTPISAEAQLATYASVVEQATADGYNGLRVAADITPLVREPSRRDAHVYWEQVADRWMTEHPLAPLCMYDTRELTGVEAIACVHPLQGPRSPQFALYADGSTEAALWGELDAFVADAFANALARLPETDTALDLTRLSFIDGRATWILHNELARRRTAGRPLVVSGVSPLLRKLWRMCDFDPALLAT